MVPQYANDFSVQYHVRFSLDANLVNQVSVVSMIQSLLWSINCPYNCCMISLWAIYKHFTL